MGIIRKLRESLTGLWKVSTLISMVNPDPITYLDLKSQPVTAEVTQKSVVHFKTSVLWYSIKLITQDYENRNLTLKPITKKLVMNHWAKSVPSALSVVGSFIVVTETMFFPHKHQSCWNVCVWEKTRNSLIFTVGRAFVCRTIKTWMWIPLRVVITDENEWWKDEFLLLKQEVR